MKTCSAINCRHTIRDYSLFCSSHVSDLPGELQSELRRLWRQGERDGADVVKHRWLYAAMRAREAIAKKEGYPVPYIPHAIMAAAKDEAEGVTA